MTHELKILPKYFDAVNCGKKNFEIRVNDRDYQEHDELVLKEWYRGKYTGRECRRWVGYIYHGDGAYGIAENTVVMALKRSKSMTSVDGTATANHFYGREGQEAQMERSACDTCQLYNSGIPCGVEPSVCKREVTDTPQTRVRYCNDCKWFRNKQVCGRCRSRNLFAEADTPQTEGAE